MENSLSATLDGFTLEQLSYGVTINQLDGRYLKVNKAFCDICEYDETQVLNMGFQDLTHPEDVKPNIELDEQLKRGEIPFYQMAKRYITRSGQVKHVLLQVSLIRNDDQTPKFYYAQVIDVSDINSQHNALGDRTMPHNAGLQLPSGVQHSAVAYDLLKLYSQQNLRKFEHLAHIAHELKNPLNGVKGMGGLMREAYLQGNTEHAESMFQLFNKSCDVMTHLITELLDLTYIEMGALSANNSHFDICELLTEVVLSHQHLALSHSLNLHLDLNNVTTFEVYQDKSRMWEILSNLISNGIKYTERGKVTVLFRTENDGSFEIEVVDTGVGISEPNQTLIFDEFSKVHSTVNKDVDSTGLGLAITKRLVNLLNGQISVESKLNVGSRFIVSFASSSKTN